MSTRKSAEPVNKGRKSAYVARNRTAILKAAQQLLGEQGSEASIETFALAAQVSVSTLYKHFENKDALVTEAYAAAFHQWELDSDLILNQISDPLEELVAPMRLFLRLKSTHPTFAAMMTRNLVDLPAAFAKTEEGLMAHIGELLRVGQLKFDHPEIRIRFISTCIVAAVGMQMTKPGANESDADAAIEVILSLLEIPAATAKKLAYSKLPELKLLQ